MIPLHRQIASESYWSGPEILNEVSLRFGTFADDFMNGKLAIRAIDKLFDRFVESGTQATQFCDDELLSKVADDELLKVVQDLRLYPAYTRLNGQLDSPALFDILAQTMVTQLLFRGRQTSTTVIEDGSTFNLSRRTLYLSNSVSGLHLAGKRSSLLGRGGVLDDTELVRIGEPVGHVRTINGPSKVRQTKIISAELIKMNGHMRDNTALKAGSAISRYARTYFS